MKKNTSSNAKQELEQLEKQLIDLVEICDRLKNENGSLRDQQSNLIAERAVLIEKNEMARSRVEAMISRLKAMENSQ